MILFIELLTGAAGLIIPAIISVGQNKKIDDSNIIQGRSY